MLGFLISLMICCSIILFLIGYAALNSKAEKIVLWFSGNPKEGLIDKEGFLKFHDKHQELLSF